MRKILNWLLATTLIICGATAMLTACSANDDNPSKGEKTSADLVVYGKIFTSEDNQVVEAFAVKDGKYVNALLVVSPDAALEETAQYIQQDFNKVEAQYQQSRKHGKKEDPQPDGGKDDGEGGDVTPVTPEA
jgi:putative cell wall-binding protein